MALGKINWFRHLLGIVGLGSFAAMFALAHYLGAFKSVEISMEDRDSYSVIYVDHRGPYHKIIAAIEKVESWAKLQNLNCPLTYGEYLDDPNSQEESRLRSRGGCIFSTAPAFNLNNLPEGFKFDTIPAQKYVVAVFKGSPGIGPMKVYPKLFSFLEDNHLQKKGSIFEVYSIEDGQNNKMTTTYLVPVQ